MEVGSQSGLVGWSARQDLATGYMLEVEMRFQIQGVRWNAPLTYIQSTNGRVGL